jgi:hypothetical protein
MSGSQLQDDLVDTAQELAEHADVDTFVISWLEYLRGVTYVDFDKPNPDLHCVRTIWESFGRPKKFTEEALRDSVHDLHGRGKIEMNRYEVEGTQVTGSKGKVYPQKYRVIVTR